jgi:virginiamycin A acetyltransferase
MIRLILSYNRRNLNQVWACVRTIEGFYASLYNIDNSEGLKAEKGYGASMRLPVRKWLWQLLGVRYATAKRLFRRTYITEVDWVTMGRRSYHNGALVWRFAQNEHLTIGKYCSIAYGVNFICGAGQHNYNHVSTFPLVAQLVAKDAKFTIGDKELMFEEWYQEYEVSNGPIVVGNDVWIGINAVIQSGVVLNHGSVVLPGAVVTTDVPPYAVVGGIPAKVVKYRFDEKTIEGLLKIAWWDWSEELIAERIGDFYQSAQNFVAKYSTA